VLAGRRVSKFLWQLPTWSTEPVYFARWPDYAFAAVGLLLCVLLIIWWRQQTRNWFRITMITLLIALVLCIASFYLFHVPAYYASCPQGCLGWRGYPRPFATTDFNQHSVIAPLDFLLNWLMLWLLWLVASVVWRLLGVAMRWPERGLRIQLIFITLTLILPWALMPRFLEPPQPITIGEDLRLATNARRSAEFTYGITGLWVQRLALEDVHRLTPTTALENEAPTMVGSQVCLRGYTYFYIPWRRYRIDLDTNGVTALSLSQLPLTTQCWE